MIPALQDWYSRGAVTDNKVLLSALLWLTAFYHGPAIIFYQLKQHVPGWQTTNIWRDLSTYLLLMFIGMNLVAEGLSSLFTSYHLSLFDRGMSAFLWGTFFYTLYRIWSIAHQLRLERELRQQAQLQALRSQLNPHFMFNSLNTISAFVYDKPEQAEQVIHQLADILRYSLDHSENDQVTLAKELSVIQQYLAIEQARFGDALQVEISTDQSDIDTLVPALIIQPLVENCIKHAKGKSLALAITATTDNNRNLTIRVMDNGPGFPDSVLHMAALPVINENISSTNGHGLAICKQRMALVPGGSLQLSNHSCDRFPGACCTIQIRASRQGKTTTPDSITTSDSTTAKR